MMEAYAFLAMFAVQILAASVLYPTLIIRYVRGWARDYGSGRFAQLYPGIDYDEWVERFVTGYRAANIVIALLGVVLLGWLFTVIRHPDWVKEVGTATLTYFLVQMSPLSLYALYAVMRYHKLLLQPSQETKRKASLQRRGLFDFISPFAVYFAVVTYFLFIAYGIWLDLYVYKNTTLSRPCYMAIISVTFVYAMNAFIIYKSLYGRRNPLVTHEGRVHAMGLRVKVGVYSSIAVAWFISVFGTLGQPDLLEWRPFALSAFFVITTLLCLVDATAPKRKAEADETGASSEVPS